MAPSVNRRVRALVTFGYEKIALARVGVSAMQSGVQTGGSVNWGLALDQVQR